MPHDYKYNIFWSDIPKDAEIYDLGKSYVAHLSDGRKGLVYWVGEEAGKAQRMLKARALPKESRPPPSKRRTAKEIAKIKVQVEEFKKQHPEVYENAPSNCCVIICRFPRRH